MIYINETDKTIEKHKAKLGLTGDVYVVENHIASLESHKKVFLESTATTIEDAQQEMINYLENERIETARLASLSKEQEQEEIQ